MTAEHGSPTGGCVLVVDDEVSIREALCELVELAGCAAVSAANGAEGLEILASRRPCLVILDLLMPVMSGHEMWEAMRRDPDLATVPVVISTSAPDMAPAGLPVIAKPVNVAKVVDWLRRSCSCTVWPHRPADA